MELEFTYEEMFPNFGLTGRAALYEGAPVTPDQVDELTETVLGYGQTNGSIEVRERISSLYPGQGIDNVLVTNGYLNRGPLEELIPFIDAVNVDLKSMDDVFYRKVCKARLEPVLESIRAFHEAGVHLETLQPLVRRGHRQQLRRLVEGLAHCVVARLAEQLRRPARLGHGPWPCGAAVGRHRSPPQHHPLRGAGTRRTAGRSRRRPCAHLAAPATRPDRGGLRAYGRDRR